MDKLVEPWKRDNVESYRKGSLAVFGGCLYIYTAEKPETEDAFHIPLQRCRDGQDEALIKAVALEYGAIPDGGNPWRKVKNV